MKSRVLVLNQSYEPMSVCDAKKAIVLVFAGKAQMVATYPDQSIRAVSVEFPLPSVVRLNFYVAVPFKRIMLNRKNILRRDNFECQYCGRTDLPLTIDHIVPKSQGGGDTWNNLVTACTKCNNKKANRTPEQAGMPLRSTPVRPSHVMFMQQYVGTVFEEWKPYLYMT
ncbi:HNH endonuclease [Chloroherpeton thalassium ATCC 35110]|uniref:HNH endonuclease n=1 Tax=Chloroherpeton thalassium (strain ATCC 35110 / GB-78) TaxID=517418 RepID=B3QS11_CHLT3|nr:HNH endonuclease [Chloroherpeton thalassium]ACF13956.1 HNH endonuclease [Chloroherpeton thalassium ATCC 35110]